MTQRKDISLPNLLESCADSGRVAGICIESDLSPIGGAGASVNPAIYSGHKYQHDKRWENSDTLVPSDVIVLDSIPSQANRLEAALDSTADHSGIPRFVLDLSNDEFVHLPPHLPRRISSLMFPHRNADAYLRDSLIDDVPFPHSDLGCDILSATATEAAALMAWFPQALLYGFWQSHLGKNRSQAKHARVWNSEIVGWNPAVGGDPEQLSGTLGTKGDPLNLQDTARVAFNKDDLLAGWDYVEGSKSGKTGGKKADALSNIGHGQIPFKESDATPMAVSFRRITQSATCSFAQLRQVRLGKRGTSEQDTAARAVVAALGLYAHQTAFGRGFALRSGTDLAPERTHVRLHGSPEAITLGDTASLLKEAVDHARHVGVPLDGWYKTPIILRPSKSLTNAIVGSWPNLGRGKD